MLTKTRRFGRSTLACAIAAFALTLAPPGSAQETQPSPAPVTPPSASANVADGRSLPPESWTRMERNARSLRIAGGTILGLGIAMQLSGTVLFGIGLGQGCESCTGKSPSQEEFLTGLILLPVGAAAIIAGSITLGVGSSRQHRLRVTRP